MASSVELPNVFVGHVGNHGRQLGVRTEEVLARIGTALGLVGLVVSIDGLFHPLQQEPLFVSLEHRIPAVTPQHLEHVPPRAAKRTLELLNDLAVAANRPVEPLQIAVHDEDEIVETLARREADRTERLGFVHLAVAHEGPNLATFGREQAPVLEILHEASLVDGHDRPEAHGDGRELPE